MVRPLAKLVALGPRGWQDLLKAQWALLRAQRFLDSHPLGSFTVRGDAAAAPVAGDPARARAIALAVDRVARHGLIRPFCLVRAMAIRARLVDEGIRGAEIRVGVRIAHGEFQAHAWVRWGHEVLGDTDTHVRGFTEVDDLRLLERR